MADQIMGGVVEMVMGGDDDESDGDGKEGRTEVCPSVPEMGIVPRLVARQVTVPRLAEVAIIVPLGGLVLGAGGTKHWEASKLGFLGMQIALVLFSFIVPCHRRTIAPGGMLEQLGVGKRLISEKDCKALMLFANFLCVPVGLIFAFSVVLISAMLTMLVSGASMTGGEVGLTASMSLCLFLVIVPLLAWWHSLKAAALLAEDAVDDVIEDIKSTDVGDEAWDSLVIPAVMNLVTDTLPTLSHGWGLSLGLLFAGCGPLWLGYLNNFLWWGNLTTGMLLIAIPVGLFLVASDVAAASSKCDDLMNALNQKRFTSPTIEVDSKLQVVEHALERLNRNQGLGFTVGTKVLDKVTLRNMAAVVASVGSALVPIIIAVWISEGSKPMYVSGLDVYQVPSGRFYSVSHVARNYTASVAYCASRGMEIASVHSQSDADSLEFLLSRTRSELLYDVGTGTERQGDNNSYFLGAKTRSTSEGEFVGWEWEDGSPWDFEHKHFTKDFQKIAAGSNVHLLHVPGKGWEHTGGNFWVVGEYHIGNAFPVICGAPGVAVDDFCSRISRSAAGMAWATTMGACDGSNNGTGAGGH
jgi:hypothetical protein